ncbi:hypothetical protein BT93_B1170 [Corymbia citriodora subsp. variegata]|nr:hypothetical protein BT93_B1170 [Corymbia citriodora subsp. variegata]
MASSLKPKRIYHVFLSFKGMDVRNNFLGHLYAALDLQGIYTYIDSEKLRKGEQIGPALMKAIEESQIAIVVFSEDYASSSWCLEELAKIMECKKQRDLMVFPVFYKVEPKEVRPPREKYRQAMVKHESKFGKESEEVKRWKKALFDASNLSGWHLNDGDESKLIQKIVKVISIHLDRTPLLVAKHPVGIDSQVVKLKSMLNLEFDDGVLVLGLWGQGGIGKTTLAKALYNDIYGLFDGSCYLANVREALKDDKGLVSLQEKLLSEILLLQHPLNNIDRGINLIRDRLHCKKVLLILDDVNHLDQLNALAGESKWFGNGSRIIITTRDKQLLTCYEIEQVHMHEVKPMDCNQAYELLSKHASPTHQKLKINTKLVNGVLDYANGLPLALEVLGSFLRCRSEDEWESTLDKISAAPNKDINNVLKISYEGLEENEKKIFLHIACFFKGWEIEHVKKILDSCDLKATIGLKILIERSLIRIEHNLLQMHDLTQLMGMDFVNQENSDPGRRSRLWTYDDVLHVLSHDMGDCAVEAIMLKPLELTKIYINSDAFTKMRRLRLLILHNVNNSFQEPIFFPNELRWLEWGGCTFRSLEFSYGEKKLVGLDLSNCSITMVPTQLKGFQQLKYIKLSHCNSLVSADLSCAPNLEELHVFYCKKLLGIHESVANHDKLRVLDLSRCDEFSVFPMLQSKNLQRLSIYMCNKLERFPDIPHKLEGLKELDIFDSGIKEIPTSVENLCSLESMDLIGCKNLASLPSNIYNLQNIERFRIVYCSNFIEFPKYEESTGLPMKLKLSNLRDLTLRSCNLSKVGFLDDLSCFPFLHCLNLSGNNITSLPTSISKRDRLSWLNLYNCRQLQEIPQLPPSIYYLDVKGNYSLQMNGHLTSIDPWVHRALTQHPSCALWLPGEEMPKWFQPLKESSISFMTSKNLCDKFLGLVFYCAGFDRRVPHPVIRIEAYFNGKMWSVLGTVNVSDSPSKKLGAIYYCGRPKLWDEVDFGQIDGSYAQFKLEWLDKWKKHGFRIICKPLEEDLKIEIRDHQLINPAFLYEIGHDSIDPKAKTSRVHNDNPIGIDLPKNLQESSHMEEDNPIEINPNLQDCQRSPKEHSQRGSKRKREFTPPQDKRIKRMLASDWTKGDENEMGLIDLLENLRL